MKVFKNISKSRAWLVGILATLVILIAIFWSSLNFSSRNRMITGVKITLKPDTGVYFISIQDVSNIITKIAGNPNGKSLSQINLPAIESALKSSPYIETAQVFASMDGKLNVQVKQRIPVLKVVNTLGETFYLDSSGFKMGSLDKFVGNIPIANGFIPEKLNDSNRIHSYALQHLLKIAKYIYSHPFWNAQFEQCYVDNFSNIILVPRVGRHSIVLGSADNLPRKMENLRIFYIKGLPNLGWETYHTINLKYNGMIVGVRGANQSEHKTKTNVQNEQH